jgi:hypothetical protein
MKVTWKPCAHDVSAAQWDAWLLGQEHYNLFQTHEWGEHRRRAGWLPRRFVALNERGEVVRVIQCLERTYFSLASFVWVPGGPAGDAADWAGFLTRELPRLCGARNLYCRLNAVRADDPGDASALQRSGFARPSVRVGSRLSMELVVHEDLEKVRSGASKNWRRNLKRSERHDLRVEHWIDPKLDELMALYAEMEKLKGLPSQQKRADLENLFSALGEKIILYQCRDPDGRLVAARGCGVVGERAWDLIAAADTVGRKVYASYATFWALLAHCSHLGVRRYDLYGVDPETNPGVYNFKKGTGAAPFEYLGEWEFATSRWMRVFANLLLRYR